MDVDTARSLYCLNSFMSQKYLKRSPPPPPPVRYDILAKSPVYQRLNNSITNVDIQIDKREQKQLTQLANVLMSLTNLRHIELWGISEDRKYILSVLESIGDRLQHLGLHNTSKGPSIHDIMRTCPKLVKLTLYYDNETELQENGTNIYCDQLEMPSMLPVLNCLRHIIIENMDQQMCSDDMLTALLQSHCLSNIHVTSLEAMSDDVLFNVLSTPGGVALSKVIHFSVTECALITAVSLVHWLTKENCSLQYMVFKKCPKIDCKILTAADVKYPKTLVIHEKYF